MVFQINIAKWVRIAVSVALLAALSFFLFRYFDEHYHLTQANLPAEPPSSLNLGHTAKVRLDDVAAKRGMSTAQVIAFPEIVHLVSKDIDVLRAGSFDAQEHWRKSQGLPERVTNENLPTTVELSSTFFSKLTLDLEHAELFLVQEGHKHYYFKTEEFNTRLVTFEQVLPEEEGRYLKVAPDARLVTAKIPIRLPADFSGSKEGFLVMTYTDGVKPPKWTMLRIGIMSKEKDISLLGQFLPFVREYPGTIKYKSIVARP